jgi:hypothetical protein
MWSDEQMTYAKRWRDTKVAQLKIYKDECVHSTQMPTLPSIVKRDITPEQKEW